MRQTMKNYRPDHVVLGGHGRYIENVHTEVAYGDPVWPDGRPDYKDIAAAGGVCGPRAWFARFCYRSFGPSRQNPFASRSVLARTLNARDQSLATLSLR